MFPRSLKTKITTPRLQETRDFYTTVLGLRVVEEWYQPDDAGCILTFEDDEPIAFLEIYHGPGEHDYSGLSLQFRTEDLGAFKDSLPEDVGVRGPVARPWGSTYLYLTDPNGISVVVFEGGL